MRPIHRGLVVAAAAFVLLPASLAGCGLGRDDADEQIAKPQRSPAEEVAVQRSPVEEVAVQRSPAEEAAARSRERVQAYLDAMIAKDVAAGRSQLCALLHDGFDPAATGPNGDFADHFQVPQATITDVRSGQRGQEVSVSVSVTAGRSKIIRPLLFTVTGDGGDWCIAGESPGDNQAVSPSPKGLAPSPAS
ncbi:hypothetical protein ACLQ24_02750 [Micromonospora sp. DT4]|uniref:hypothetical protein n=1 Tax=Micromonospora sp. DT4 TaxID=3393438 RepID=UPI003CF26855